MRLFRRVPTPFAITYLVSGLLRESFQKRKADKYAAQVVHHYKPGESPYSSRTVVIYRIAACREGDGKFRIALIELGSHALVEAL